MYGFFINFRATTSRNKTPSTFVTPALAEEYAVFFIEHGGYMVSIGTFASPPQIVCRAFDALAAQHFGWEFAFLGQRLG